ncbi:MAG: hypothetical protein H0X42_11250 [Solirubrobacterales bacterium]|nr:hypothetical protein [Solirubrobacterales bacterium]
MRKATIRIGRRARGLTAVLAVAMVAAAMFASAAQAVPATFWGVVPQETPSQEEFQRLQRGGVDSVRIPIGWASLQPNRGGPIDWTSVDAIVERAAQTGTEILPFITGAPTWAVPPASVPGTGNAAKAPAHLPVTGSAATAWRLFLEQGVLRYGPAGSFWVTHPALPERAIRTWQIWNEENFKYFVAKPNPAEYGLLVKLSYKAIKGVDPGAKVILGGMFSKPKGGQKKTANRSSPNFFASYFLEQMYKHNPGIKTKFNGVALHPYTPGYTYLSQEIEAFRAVLAQNKDSAKGLWLTELGWSSEPPNPSVNIFAKGIAGQARELKGAFSLLVRNQAKWRLQRVYWFSVDDLAGACNFCDGSGLFGEGFAPKKAWYEYVKFAGGTP